MKKIIFACFGVSLMISCQKDVSETHTNISSSSRVDAAGAASAKNSTVTTESALISAVENATAGDVITVSGTIKPTNGFACKLSAGSGNKFENCTADHNSDDGWDLYDQPSTVKILNCTAKNNGYGSNGDGNGFKLGSSGQNVPHTVTGCKANNNKANGYTGKGNKGKITITGSGGSGNGKRII